MDSDMGSELDSFQVLENPATYSVLVMTKQITVTPELHWASAL